MAKLFLGNLPYTVTEDEIEQLMFQAGFVRIGTEPMPEGKQAVISSIRVVRDRDTGLSRGFGFVEITGENAARRAVERLTTGRAALGSRELVIDIAKEGAGTGSGLNRRS